MKFLEYLGNYLISGSSDANCILGLLIVIFFIFVTIFIVENLMNKKRQAKKDFSELEKKCGKMR